MTTWLEVAGGLFPRLLLSALLVATTLVAGAGAGAEEAGLQRAYPPIPVLNWEPRSDWRSVKAAGAVGDGVADDTAAIQGLLDTVGQTATVYPGDRDNIYFPPGVYRLTAPLRIGGEVRLNGVTLIGHGRASRLVWDGPPDQPMLIANGITNARYEGLVFEGRGRAGVGILHPNKFFSTESGYRHLAFLNFTNAGILVDPTREQAQAEPYYENCYFESCARGVAFLRWNDYNHTFDGCEFRDCGIGIECDNGSFYVRNTHFAGSHTVDIKAHPMHSSSIRRVTSVGSQGFLLMSHASSAVTLQDVHVARTLRYSGGDIRLSGGTPVTIFDCVFTCPEGGSYPLSIASTDQPVILSNNRVEGAPQLVSAGRGRLYHVPPGRRGGSLRSAEQTFLRDTVEIPGKVFDARRDFGAVGDGRADDTAALQATIDAAREHGQGALAYFPGGAYLVKDTLQITGADYTVGGQGWGTYLRWGGAEDGTMIHVHDPQRVALEGFQVATGPEEKTAIDLLQTSSGAGSSIRYDGIRVFGCYQKQPFRKGLHLSGLGARDRVVINTLQGNLRVTNSAAATILGNYTYEGSVIVEGAQSPRTGFFGLMTRLATIVTHALYVRDNLSFVASDFYNEQSDGMFHLSGSPELPPGRVVVTGGRSHLWAVGAAASEIDNYRGEVFLGGKEFSDYRTAQDPPSRLLHRGTAPVDLYLFGNLFYGSRLLVEKQDSLRLFMIGNARLPDERFVKWDPVDDYDEAALAALARAFDDLRRLGELDLRFNHREALRGS